MMFVVLPNIDAGPLSKVTLLRITRQYRFIRLIRLTRLLRLFKVFHELALLVSGIVSGMRTVMWSFFLLALPIFSLSIVIRQHISIESAHAGDLEETFPSV